MYLKVGGNVRPFCEADVLPQYQLFYDGQRQLYKTGITMQIEGRIVQQTSATQSGMTNLIRLLQQQLAQTTPDVILLEDDGVTESAISLKSANCISGPLLLDYSLGANEGSVYPTSLPYSATYYGEVASSSGANPITFFNETLDKSGGGPIRVHVGGAINVPEEQIGQQYEVYRYVQAGSARGLYGYPLVPQPIFPGSLKRPGRVVLGGPQERGRINMEFLISWTYEFESAYELFGVPHTFTV